ncbi:uncharacterized protein LOC124647518 [Lolium rigidum]|uniref:uncharacterized protein LOC124647518 n=1 Tax=Lolium rigidum TaxID=89674 RepID=UPI001F5D4770|nr:uncharacterized protein LOC124647518 [Lolium rigidum]
MASLLPFLPTSDELLRILQRLLEFVQQAQGASSSSFTNSGSCSTSSSSFSQLRILQRLLKFVQLSPLRRRRGWSGEQGASSAFLTVKLIALAFWSMKMWEYVKGERGARAAAKIGFWHWRREAAPAATAERGRPLALRREAPEVANAKGGRLPTCRREDVSSTWRLAGARRATAAVARGAGGPPVRAEGGRPPA